MATIINDTIRHLLMEEEQVCLPGLGTLRLLPQPALISPLEGKAAAPSEQVTFNPNLVLDDGRILRALEGREGLTHEDALLQLGEFLRNMQENLDAGRSVTVGGLGRFFKHFDGQISFTSGGDNYSKDSFGLPSIELRPIVRTEKQRRSAADPMLANPAVAPAATAVKNRLKWAKRLQSNLSNKEALLYNPELRKILWWISAGVGMLLVLFIILKLGQQLLSRTTDVDPIARTKPDRIQVPADRVNVAPGPKPVDADRVAPDEPPRLNDPVEENQPYVQPTNSPVRDPGGNTATNVPSPANATVPNTTNPTAATNKTAYIATGRYGSQRNVEKNIDRIRAAGFDSFTRPEDGLTRIGAKVEYASENELNAALERLQRIYADAFVLE
ncbi:MAG: nucleoid DNA-binding protein/cell division septation protein DedD [Neolewinella sp.]|jgi:cell division septation protein DedD